MSGLLPVTDPVLVDPWVLAEWLGVEVDPADRTESEVVPSTGPGFVPASPAPSPGTVKLLDVRWTPLGGGAHEDYLQGHLPGAVYVSLSDQLAGQGEPQDGRHPLPSPEDFSRAVRMWGIDEGDTVVVYDDSAGTSAARAWWLLRHAGIRTVYLLDGGLRLWREAGLPLQAGEVIPVHGSARTGWDGMPVLDIESAGTLPERGLLLDARAAERFRGEQEPLDPQAGHIPGALNAPATSHVSPAGRFLPAEVLAERFAALGASPDGRAEVGAYCGSGVTAAHVVAALQIAGIPAALFPGSWSAWSTTPGRPVATGV